MCLDDLKTTMGMEMLRCQSPELAEKEVLVYLISHNLIRWTMATAATRHAVPLERISFKGTCDALPTFREAIGQARSEQKREELWETFLQTIAKDLVPARPGRREPRAVKRKRNKYPRLNKPRHQFKDHPKRNDRRKAARLRKRGLN